MEKLANDLDADAVNMLSKPSTSDDLYKMKKFVN